MADIVEIVTEPNQDNVFYKISSGCLRFQVKGDQADIGLAEKSGCHCEITIHLCSSTITVTRNTDVLLTLVSLRTLVSDDVFRKFWIQLIGQHIWIGLEQADKPIVAYTLKTKHFQYVGLRTSKGYGRPVHWRLELPPLLEQIKVKPVSDGVLKWVQASDQLPDGALIGGYETEMLYIIRAEHEGSLTPGKYVPSKKLGYIAWGGISNEKTEFEVLCGYDCIWVPCDHGTVPAGALEAGYSQDHGQEKLYVGRARHSGYLIPGKVQPSHRVCYIPFDDIELAVKHYEVLVVPGIDARSNNLYNYNSVHRESLVDQNDLNYFNIYDGDGDED